MHPVRLKPKAVLYDFGGVFCESPLARFADFESEHRLPAQFLANTINARAGHAVSGQTLLSLMQLPLRSAVAQHHRAVIDAGFKTACITNSTPGSRASTWVPVDSKVATEHILSAFDVLIESADEGIRKPDPAIYTLTCQRLGIHPSDCVFLDDLGVNLKPARALGMRTIKVAVYDWKHAFDTLADITGVPFTHA